MLEGAFYTHDPKVLAKVPERLRRCIPAVIAPGAVHRSVFDVTACRLTLAMTMNQVPFEAQARILSTLLSECHLDAVSDYAHHAIDLK